MKLFNHDQNTHVTKRNATKNESQEKKKETITSTQNWKPAHSYEY